MKRPSWTLASDGDDRGPVHGPLPAHESPRRTITGRFSAGLLCIVIACWPLFAGSSPRFRILDALGRPVAHARVSIFGNTGSVQADGEAVFTLEPVPRLPFLLSVVGPAGNLIGVVRVVSLQSEGIQELHLSPMEHLEVTVQTGVAPTTLAPPAAGATLLSRGERNQTMPARTAEMLREAPGTEALGSGHPAVPSVRGLARGRTLILLDGARVTAERRAGPSASYLDPFTLESLEIVRGPGSVVYGSDAMGGIIHGRTPQPGSEGPEGRFEAGVGTGIPLATGAAEIDFPMPRGGLLFQVHQRAFDEYDAPGGEVPDSGVRDRGFLVKSLVTTDRSRWTLGLRVDQSRDMGKPREETARTTTRYPEEDSTRLTASAILPPPGLAESLELDLFLGSYSLITEREERSGDLFDQSDIRSGDGSFRLVAGLPAQRGAFRVGLDAWSRFGLTASTTNIVRDPNTMVATRTEEEPIESADRLDAGLFVERSVPVFGERLTLAGGLRGQGVWTRNDGGLAGDERRSTGTMTGYAATTWEPGAGWSATLQAARGFREPGLSDRYYTGVTGRGTITGNPDLDREISRQLDLAVRRSGARSRFAAYAYRYTIDDLITRLRLVSGGPFVWRNVGEAEITGAELESEWRLPGSLSLRLIYGQAYGKDTEDGGPLADIPARQARISLGHGTQERVWWRGAWSWTWQDDREGQEEAETPGYGVLDLSGGVRLGGNLEVRLAAGNVLDREHIASADSDTVVAPGRNATLILAGSFP